MTQRQLNKFKVISLAIDSKITIVEAAEDHRSLVSAHFIRLKKEGQEFGPDFLIHLGVKQQRSLDNGKIFSYYGRHFKVIEDGSAPIPPRSKIRDMNQPGIRPQGSI